MEKFKPKTEQTPKKKQELKTIKEQIVKNAKRQENTPCLFCGSISCKGECLIK